MLSRLIRSYSHRKRIYLKSSNFRGLYKEKILYVKRLIKHYKYFIIFTVTIPESVLQFPSYLELYRCVCLLFVSPCWDNGMFFPSTKCEEGQIRLPTLVTTLVPLTTCDGQRPCLCSGFSRQRNREALSVGPT